MFLSGGFHKKPQETSQNLFSKQQWHSLQPVVSRGSFQGTPQAPPTGSIPQGSPEARHSFCPSGRAGSPSQAGSDPDPLPLPTTEARPVPDHSPCQLTPPAPLQAPVPLLCFSGTASSCCQQLTSGIVSVENEPRSCWKEIIPPAKGFMQN